MNLKNKKILVVAPHIDDEAICSGGLIMKAKKEGAKVFVLYIANGETRQFIGRAGRAPVMKRLKEAQKASVYGHFDYKIALRGDEITRLDSVPQKHLIELIENTNRTFKPDIVVLPYSNSFNQDHRAVAQAAITAFRPLPKTLMPQPRMILEMQEPYSWPVSSTPNFYIDITEFMQERLKLYKLYKTQVPKDPFPRSVNNIKRFAGIRGCDISVKYAEAYNLLKGIL